MFRNKYLSTIKRYIKYGLIYERRNPLFLKYFKLYLNNDLADKANQLLQNGIIVLPEYYKGELLDDLKNNFNNIINEQDYDNKLSAQKLDPQSIRCKEK